jgi:hypothetical protein
MGEPLLEISLYFDERIDPATQQLLYAYLVAEQHRAWLEQMQREGYLKSWAVFPPGTWRGYFKRREKASMRE